MLLHRSSKDFEEADQDAKDGSNKDEEIRRRTGFAPEAAAARLWAAITGIGS
ncbi:hypothetical protein QN219_24235 [Sinorhizobium sp. 7-81]|uniref:hypothetical protein n=1 Tax=Sinorhizobium sp. 8-89 TaxID=3049089 RepID=UPI0024C3B8A6|nr:hypothetical protein [Sinorhizobium sp. 8-89]MDK1493117.1 hypothetical protein [Sinorhizobium sp. 8-89]